MVPLYLTSCYSFRGGSVPEHLKTIYIAAIDDNSGFGDPRYRDQMMTNLIDEFLNDNTFELEESSGDARLKVTITSIREQAVTVSQGELETDRKITVSSSVEYFDMVNKKQIWSKNFTAYNLYEIAQAQQGRDEAIDLSLQQMAEDILLAVVSGW